MIKQNLKKLVSSILIWESKKVLARYHPKIVAITGSVGKTSTKDLVAHVLSLKYKLRKSEKSFNSEIGLPLTILGLSNAWSNPLGWLYNIIRGFATAYFSSDYPEMLVLEVGADRPGDIRKVAKWLHPNTVVITRIGELPVHVEFFSSPEAVAREKGALAQAVQAGGTLILNGDDSAVRGMGEGLKADVVTYGFGEGLDVVGSNEHLLYAVGEAGEVPHGITFKIDYRGKILPVHLEGAVGKHSISSALAAFAVGAAWDIELFRIVERLATFVGPPGRMKLVEGVKKSLIIDDTYNASPVAVEAALSTLESITVPGRKIAVLGDMMELGKYTIDAHKATGFQVARVADALFAVGQRARFIADGALAEGMKERSVKLFDDAFAAGEALRNYLKKGDVVLLKGSQSVRLERAVAEVMLHPDQAGNLLVRQDSEWSRR